VTGVEHSKELFTGTKTKKKLYIIPVGPWNSRRSQKNEKKNLEQCAQQKFFKE